MSKHFLFALLAVLFSVLPARAETIVVAADATWPPFEMLDENKQVTGYGPDYIRAAAQGSRLGGRCPQCGLGRDFCRPRFQPMRRHRLIGDHHARTPGHHGFYQTLF